MQKKGSIEGLRRLLQGFLGLWGVRLRVCFVRALGFEGCRVGSTQGFTVWTSALEML